MSKVHEHTVNTISEVIKHHGFDHFGFVELMLPKTLKQYESWIENELYGDMNYLKDHLPLKADPLSTFKGMRSAVVITKPYGATPHLPLRIAGYAQEKDYHLVFKNQLEVIAQDLKLKFPEDEFLCFTDSLPFLERDFATQAGLGWVGKNTCLIDRKKGSLFFIGEILSSLPLKSLANLSPDFCGTCTRCIDLCPTKAIKPNRVLDANRCISYLNIESKAIPPLELRSKIGDWFFGCDICQTVCPWNEKHHGKELMQSLSETQHPSKAERIEFLKRILTLSNKQLMDEFKDSPLSRARGYGLKRNALIVIANLKLVELKPEVELIPGQWPRLIDLCKWVVSQLEGTC